MQFFPPAVDNPMGICRAKRLDMSAMTSGQGMVSARTEVVYGFGFYLIQGVRVWKGIGYRMEVVRSIREGRYK